MSTNDMSQYDHSGNPHYSHTDTAKLNVPLSEWKKLLPADLYYIAFEKGTERAFTGKYWDFEGIGTYACAVCGNVLFKLTANSRAAAVGPASSKQHARMPFTTTRTARTVWCAPKPHAGAAARTSATSSMTDPNPRGSATASTA